MRLHHLMIEANHVAWATKSGRPLVELGEWLTWLEDEFGCKQDTARRFMDVYDASTKTSNLLDLKLPVSGF